MALTEEALNESQVNASLRMVINDFVAHAFHAQKQSQKQVENTVEHHRLLMNEQVALVRLTIGRIYTAMEDAPSLRDFAKDLKAAADILKEETP